MMSDGLIFNRSQGHANMLFFGSGDSILRGNFDEFAFGGL